MIGGKRFIRGVQRAPRRAAKRFLRGRRSDTREVPWAAEDEPRGLGEGVFRHDATSGWGVEEAA